MLHIGETHWFLTFYLSKCLNFPVLRITVDVLSLDPQWNRIKNCHDFRTTTFPINSLDFSSVQFSRSVVSDSATPWTAAPQASLSITNSQSLLKLMSIKVGDTIQPSHPLSSPSPPTFNLSQHQGLSSQKDSQPSLPCGVQSLTLHPPPRPTHPSYLSAHQVPLFSLVKNCFILTSVA